MVVMIIRHLASLKAANNEKNPYKKYSIGWPVCRFTLLRLNEN